MNTVQAKHTITVIGGTGAEGSGLALRWDYKVRDAGIRITGI